MDGGREVPDYCRVMEITATDGTVKQLVFPKGLDLDRPKRPRTTFSDRQLRSLEHEFQRNPYLVGKARGKMARELGLSETQIKVWFQNRRTKIKKAPTRLETTEKPTAELNNNEDGRDDQNGQELEGRRSSNGNALSFFPQTNSAFSFGQLPNQSVKSPNVPLFPMSSWFFGVQNERTNASFPFSTTPDMPTGNQFCSNFFCYP